MQRERVWDQDSYRLWMRLKSRARRKGLEFDLTQEDCADLAPCEYCGDPATGFDRVDSGGGYTKDNVVPACGTCNRMKHTMTTDEWFSQMRRILSYK